MYMHSNERKVPVHVSQRGIEEKEFQQKDKLKNLFRMSD